jgi:uncharacterized protein (TIGR02246 family)
MLSRRALRVIVPLAFLILLGTITRLHGWTEQGQARSQGGSQAQSQQPQQPSPSGAANPQAAAGRKPPSPAEQAILSHDGAFVREYNQADSKALAARFTEDAEVIEENGDRYQGRPLIQQRLAETFSANPGVKIAIEIETIRFLNADVAKEEGRTIITPAKGSPVVRPYTALFVRRDGRWLISSIREESDPLVRPHDRLQDLEWMIGEWLDESDESLVRVNCHWSQDQNFLIREFTVKRAGKPVMTVNQRIGWDPLARQVRSWEFDSEGGFGEGRWSRDGQRWVVKHTGVRPDGLTASATNIMSQIRPDLVRWVSIDRVLGDESIPDEEAFVLVRVPPAPRSQGQATPAPASSPNPTRRPQ